MTQLELGEFAFTDLHGNKLDILTAKEPLIMQARVSNLQPETQHFTIIFQVKDVQSFTVQLSSQGGLIEPKNSVLIRQIWLPQKAGQYSIEVFLWKNLITPVPLGLSLHAQTDLRKLDELASVSTNLQFSEPHEYRILPIQRNITLYNFVRIDNKQELIEKLVNQSGFLFNKEKSGLFSFKEILTPFKLELISLKQLTLPSQILQQYANILSANTGWPSKENPIWTSAIEEGDQIAKVNWSLGSQQIQTFAIVDPQGRVKFEPLMYFMPSSITVGGSSDKLEVKNMLGWTVVKAKLETIFDSPDNCSIVNAVPKVEIETALLYYAKSIEKVDQFQFGKCPSHSNKVWECVRGQAVVAYRAIFPKFDVSYEGFSIGVGEFNVHAGTNTLVTERICP